MSMWLAPAEALWEVVKTAGQMVGTGVEIGKSVTESVVDTAETVVETASEVFFNR